MDAPLTGPVRTKIGVTGVPYVDVIEKSVAETLPATSALHIPRLCVGTSSASMTREQQ